MKWPCGECGKYFVLRYEIKNILNVFCPHCGKRVPLFAAKILRGDYHGTQDYFLRLWDVADSNSRQRKTTLSLLSMC